MLDDRQLDGLVIDRQRLLRQLAPLLRRVGASNPKRHDLNAERAVRRKAIRKSLRQNAELIAARVMELNDELTL